jgi:putative phosphoribosyl transferase
MSATLTSPRFIHQRVPVNACGATLMPSLTLPAEPRGLVVVTDASGDRTYTRGNRSVAARLQRAGFATLEVDLLTLAEAADDAETSVLRFDTQLVAGRLVAVLEWAAALPALCGLEVGVFASGTCAAGVLAAAAQRPELIQSIVCRGARPDLAGSSLAYVCAATLLILGERDVSHLAAHQSAMALLPLRSCVEFIPEAGHLLEESAEIDRVGRLSTEWFGDTLRPGWLGCADRAAATDQNLCGSWT